MLPSELGDRTGDDRGGRAGAGGGPPTREGVGRTRRGLLACLAGLGTVPLAGCAGVLPVGSPVEPEFPGGTLVVENAGNRPAAVSVRALDRRPAPTLDERVGSGETAVEESFVTADRGEAVELSARVGGDDRPITFEFLPAGGESAPPEVATLTVTDPVAASATWTATEGQ